MFVSRRLVVSLVVLAWGLPLASAPASAATLLVNGSGILTGATGVDVGGTPYDVEFVEGACYVLFHGCNSAGDFTFTTQAGAASAGQALLDQVFLDNAVLGAFDSNPALTFGCGSSLHCFIDTPYALIGSGVWINSTRNSVADAGPTGDAPDFVTPYSVTTNTADSNVDVYARWTPSDVAAPVPEPASLTLLGLGLAGMGARRWRQRRTS